MHKIGGFAGHRFAKKEPLPSWYYVRVLAISEGVDLVNAIAKSMRLLAASATLSKLWRGSTSLMPPGKPMLLSIQRLLDSFVQLLRKPSVRLLLQKALEARK